MTACPQWLISQPAVSSVWRYFSDYKRGALGPVWELPAALFEALEVLEIEEKRRENWLNEEQVKQHGS